MFAMMAIESIVQFYILMFAMAVLIGASLLVYAARNIK